MKKKLGLNRETVRTLSSEHAVGILAGALRAHETFDSGETYCWCSQGCPPSGGGGGPVETSGCNVA